jgi:hypothetical protein
VQGGFGAFCRACGKLLDASDLEFHAVDSSATTGNDVVLSSGGGKGRSALVILAVLAALGGLPEHDIVTLAGYDVRDGHRVTKVAIAESARLIGSDSANHPVVVDYGRGTYSFDPATQEFTLLTTNRSSLVRGDWWVERTCTEPVACSVVVLHGTDSPRPIPGLAVLGQPSLSPNGQTLVQASIGDDGRRTLQATDLITGTQQRLDMATATENVPLSWSADSRWLFGLNGGRLSAWKVGTTETLPLAFDGDPVRVANVGVFPS